MIFSHLAMTSRQVERSSLRGPMGMDAEDFDKRALAPGGKLGKATIPRNSRDADIDKETKDIRGRAPRGVVLVLARRMFVL